MLLVQRESSAPFDLLVMALATRRHQRGQWDTTPLLQDLREALARAAEGVDVLQAGDGPRVAGIFDPTCVASVWPRLPWDMVRFCATKWGSCKS